VKKLIDMERPVQTGFWGKFTDRGRGQGFVLSEQRAASWTGRKCKHIKAYCINTAGVGCMKSELLGMCQNIAHVYKQM